MFSFTYHIINKLLCHSKEIGNCLLDSLGHISLFNGLDKSPTSWSNQLSKKSNCVSCFLPKEKNWEVNHSFHGVTNNTYEKMDSYNLSPLLSWIGEWLSETIIR